jgi:hypothetical protein
LRTSLGDRCLIDATMIVQPQEQPRPGPTRERRRRRAVPGARQGWRAPVPERKP